MAPRTLEFVRGDANYHQFSIPTDFWTPGGRLFFAAKPVIDDDTVDANAVINHNWGDDVVSDVVKNGVPYKRYECYFPPSVTSGIVSNGEDSTEYLAEFQFVPFGGDPVTFPPNDPKLRAIVYFDVKRRTIP